MRAAKKVIVAGWWTLDPAKRDAVVESFEDLVLRARRAPGCLDLAITADPVDSSRINVFEFWQSETDLNAWRKVSKPPRRIPPVRRQDVQKHTIQQSGPPFTRRRKSKRR